MTLARSSLLLLFLLVGGPGLATAQTYQEPTEARLKELGVSFSRVELPDPRSDTPPQGFEVLADGDHEVNRLVRDFHERTGTRVLITPRGNQGYFVSGHLLRAEKTSERVLYLLRLLDKHVVPATYMSQGACEVLKRVLQGIKEGEIAVVESEGSSFEEIPDAVGSCLTAGYDLVELRFPCFESGLSQEATTAFYVRKVERLLSYTESLISILQSLKATIDQSFDSNKRRAALPVLSSQLHSVADLLEQAEAGSSNSGGETQSGIVTPLGPAAKPKPWNRADSPGGCVRPFCGDR